ncbi:hypothetical protein PRIPAC_90979 [Pristionchus pacificus]|uniref:Uncharacterized protein n=1 Tax=Pristionchus pacificus TaxID=54126 RepID=A0A2A6CTS7_PRIPA|nr:hypothetical protein PRIPAC_90979 [Pristionchus pacificus]|eukprot:PDM81510.1 hypothetical protein PRIPAC_35386 [Pristionchus pacificus]
MLRSPTIRAPQLNQLLSEQKGRLRLFDAAYTLREPANHADFYRTNYGCFDELMAKGTHPDFVKERLPGAVHFNLDIASYPGVNVRAALYPPGLFKEYVRKLGVAKGDSVVVYGRGHSGGMLFAARAWWLLKMYGMEDVSVLEGGLETWKKEGGETTSGNDDKDDMVEWKKDFEEEQDENIQAFLEINRDGFEATAGVRILKPDWEASAFKMDRLVNYDDLMKGGLFERLDKVNMLDCRPADEFYGRKPLAFPPNGAKGARLPGSKCVPLTAVLSPSGELKSAEEIQQVLREAGYDAAKPTYTLCNGGTQAALLGLALEKAGVKWSLFNGSLREVSKRKPSLISATGEE